MGTLRNACTCCDVNNACTRFAHLFHSFNTSPPHLLLVFFNRSQFARCVAIANVLAEHANSTLIETLGLGNNNIRAKGAAALIKMLKVNKRIVALDVGDNSISEADMQTIKLAVAANKNQA